MLPHMLPLKTFLFATVLWTIICFTWSTGSAQTIRNGEFDQQLDWWFAFGPSTIEFSDDGHDGGSAARVTNRGDHWHGIGQSLVGQLEPGVDYHIQAWVKLPADQSGTMGIRMYQTDDRGERSLRLGEAKIGPDEWTLLEGAFTYDPHGEVTAFYLSFETSFEDPGTYDFLIDSVSISVNDWRAAADARIEQIRKRDARLSFVRSNGQPAAGIEVSASQIRHEFPFGSAINSQFLSDPIYADFFKTHFDWATFEWSSQWYATEAQQGTEDYSLPDLALAYCEENGINLKGHALVWGQETTRPDWLTDLSDAELESAIENRITSAVTRYGSRLYGWDVNNEMLDNEFFLDRLGPSIRSSIFLQARAANPDIKLFVNEYGLPDSKDKALRYRAIVDSLIAEGSEVAGVGFQSHFDGRVSPKGMELGLSAFEDSGLDIWFTEFDSMHPDRESRADSLEDFYRYAFSRPEAAGIVMWGFWEGRHWRPEAAIVDLDWTVNAAGQRYFDLIDEWTSETEGSADALGQFEFRGFHGSYLLSTTDQFDVVNHHLIPLNKDAASDPEASAAEFTLTASPFHESLTLNGTENDDVFEIDLSQPDQVVLNGTLIRLGLDVAPNRLILESQGGEDRLLIKTKSDSEKFTVTGVRLLDQDSGQEIRFGDIGSVEIRPGHAASQVIILDTAGDDMLESFADVSILQTATQQISLYDFSRVTAFSSFGSDSLSIFDSSDADEIWTNFNLTRIDGNGVHRRFTGFENVEITSSFGLDRLILRSFADVAKSYQISPTSIDVSLDQAETRQFRFLNMPSVIFLGGGGSADQVVVNGDQSDETLRIIPTGTLYFGNGFNYFFNLFFRNFEVPQSSPGNDRLIYRDSSADESVQIDGDNIEISSNKESHSLQGLDGASLYSEAGGEDSATVNNPNNSFRLLGDWNTSTPE